VNILEGTMEDLIDLAWHPIRPIVVSLSLKGKVYIVVNPDKITPMKRYKDVWSKGSDNQWIKA